ncbi:MAG: hypothetical protein SVU32_09295 [Candidatus Nanohaloarchaea archaeon]|nr:hypothetical protein [Candidatus Nanohaloarchaea archaeon]
MPAIPDELRQRLATHCEDLTDEEAETLASLLEQLATMTEDGLAAIDNPVLRNEAKQLHALLHGETDE